MGLFELLLKRRKFLPLFDKVWTAVSPHLAIAAGPEQAVAHRLACFHYAGVVYASVYRAALAAGMSSSTAFPLARLQLGKYPFDDALEAAVDALFSADEGSRERRYAVALEEHLGRIVAAVATTGTPPEAEIAAELTALERRFAELDFAAGGLYPPLPAD